MRDAPRSTAGTQPVRPARVRRLALATLAGAAFAAGAQEPRAVPPQVVLVLELISTSHVKPTTGVVIGADGLVLIPADFVSAGDEIVVLDGGTDIVRHGRPARTVGRIAAQGLAVLAVEGLQRPAALLSGESPSADARLRYTAFPPARELADGAAPVNRQVTLRAAGDGGWKADEAEPLPNLAGPLFDACGHLAAYNLPHGQPSLEADAQSQTLSARDIARALEAMQIEVESGRCRAAALPPRDTPEDAGQEAEPPGPESEKIAPGTGTAAEPARVDEMDPEPALPEFGGRTPDTADTEPPEPNRAWLIPAALALALAAWLAWRRRSARGGGITTTQEPDTVVLTALPGEGSTVQRVPGREARRDFEDAPGGGRPALKVDATLADGTRLRRWLVLDGDRAEAIIGRGAEIDIAGPGLSRRHARVCVENGAVTVSDLGSRNGTWVRSCPCLPGEELYVEAGDELVLGDVRVRLVLDRAGSDTA